MMNYKNKNVIIENWGLLNYKYAWNKQEEILQKIIDVKINNRKINNIKETPNYIIFLEHFPVYSIGKNGNKNNLLINNSALLKYGIDYVKTNRGGDITFHGPGQIVVYPILDLENFFTDINKYLRKLEQVIIDTLADYNLKGERSSDETGVWLSPNTPFARKICAIGVRASRWVTMHGFALNINTDLSYFENIIPCGINGKAVTSLKKELKKNISLNEVQLKIISHFQNNFDANLIYK
tara:strand:- start:1771 stop:2484 length:714 start_codon:yes stop_codon:yes gene_type:complete